MIINGNSLEVLKTFDDNSVDAVVTDPPYGLSFMGKKWDYDVPSTELWQEVFRVLKPGGHLLAFAGTRTQHRMAVNIEDAGFEIRDMIAWVYGSGFPKSLNIGKAVDKLQGNKRQVSHKVKFSDGSNMGLLDKSSTIGKSYTATKGNSPYEGWGTALKPALEPITVARKPIKGTVANNVLEYGTGGINVDGCRVQHNETLSVGFMKTNREKGLHSTSYGGEKDKRTEDWKSTDGRFPANLIHDGSDEVVGLFPETKSGALKPYKQKGTSIFYTTEVRDINSEANSGSAARFFYCAKASKGERNKGLEGFEEKENSGSYQFRTDGSLDGKPTQPKANIHPTVKPVKLMQYLVRLVTPKGGTVLDPFNGSGTTGIACKLEGFDYIGIELDPEYCKISEARIYAWEPDKQEKLI